MKILILVLATILVTVSAKSIEKSSQVENLIKYLRSVDLENIENDQIKRVAEALKQEYPLNSNTGFCCKVDTRNETVQTRTKTVSQTVVMSHETVVGYKPCTVSTTTTSTKKPGETTKFPFCVSEPIYKNTTYMGVQYSVETYTIVVVENTCSAVNLICCSDHTMVAGQCIPNGLAIDLQHLINLGLIG